jgi:UDP-N-acetylglucosamine diphosphorylase/glucosamine-1-phosphate N-acetyltransferase
VNYDISEKHLFVNSLISDTPEVWKFVERSISEENEVMFFDSTGSPVFGILDGATPNQVAKDFKGTQVKRKKVPPTLTACIRFPWQIVEANSNAIHADFPKRYSKDFSIGGDREIRGDSLYVSSSAEIERYVTLDARKGPVIIEDEAKIESYSYLTGPCFVGKGTVVRSAKIREGTSISNFCKVAGEIEETIFSDYSNKNHDGFVGHSIVGSWVNLGALTTTSDLKNTYGEISVNVNNKRIKTGAVKIGAFIGDMSKTSIGVMVSSGKTIGVSSHALESVLYDIPSFTLHGGSKQRDVEMYIDSAIETQKRMMARRGKEISKAYISMIRTVFKLTNRDRASAQVAKGKFRQDV